LVKKVFAIEIWLILFVHQYKEMRSYKNFIYFRKELTLVYLICNGLKKQMYLILFVILCNFNWALSQNVITDTTNNFADADVVNSTTIFPINNTVKDFSEVYAKKHGATLLQLKQKKKDVLALYSKILVANNLPAELMYVSIVESNLNQHAKSRAGALGTWQIMPDEAKKYGLLKAGIDGRKSHEKSTIVAAKLFNHLYNVFGDWLLVVAAYNCGEGRMKNAIRKSGSSDFWQLQPYLPLETRQHVKKFIATHLIMQQSLSEVALTNNELVAYNLQKNGTLQKLLFKGEVVAIHLNEQLDVAVLAAALSISTKELLDNNPALASERVGGTTYSLLLPKEKVILFQKLRPFILHKSKEKMYATPIIKLDKTLKTKA